MPPFFTLFSCQLFFLYVRFKQSNSSGHSERTHRLQTNKEVEAHINGFDLMVFFLQAGCKRILGYPSPNPKKIEYRVIQLRGKEKLCSSSAKLLSSVAGCAGWIFCFGWAKKIGVAWKSLVATDHL